MKRTVIEKLLCLRLAVADLLPDGNTKADRYLAVCLLKQLKARIEQRLKELDPELRQDAAAATIKGSSKTATWREHREGDVTVKQYDAKPGAPKLAMTEAQVWTWAHAKLPPELACKVVTTETKTVTTVHLDLLRALRETGMVPAADYDLLVTPSTETGKFVVEPSDRLEALAKLADADLIQRVAEQWE